MRRLSQLVVTLAGALLLLLVGVALLPEPAPDPIPPAPAASPSRGTATAVAARPSPTRAERPTPTFSPFPTSAISIVGPVRHDELAALELEFAEGVSLMRRSSAQGSVTLGLLVDTAVMAGEVAEAALVLENGGPERLRVGERLQLVLVDGSTSAEPVTLMQLEAEPALANIVRTGERHVQRVRFYVPEGLADQVLGLWAVLSFRRDNGVAVEDGRRLEVGPLPLAVEPAPPELQLHAALETDEEGWTLRLTSPEPAAQPPGLQGGIGISDPFGFGMPASGWQLAPSAEGIWRGRWSALEGPSISSSSDWGSAQSVTALVTAPGYASAVITREVTLGVAPPTYEPTPTPVRYASYEEAQAELPFPLADARRVDPAAGLLSLEVSKASAPVAPFTTTRVRQHYGLTQGWLRVAQTHGAEFDAAGRPLEVPPPSLDARTFRLGGAEGWAEQELGIWRLHWRSGEELAYLLELPAVSFSFTQAVEIARQLTTA